MHIYIYYIMFMFISTCLKNFSHMHNYINIRIYLVDAKLFVKREIQPLWIFGRMGYFEIDIWIYGYTGSGAKGVFELKGALVPQKYRICRTWTAARVGASRT